MENENEITQLQLENRDLDIRMTKIEQYHSCYTCPNMRAIVSGEELICYGCGGVFVHKNKGGDNHGI